jgi:drug/metabolite transporter (DMT)-like permease
MLLNPSWIGNLFLTISSKPIPPLLAINHMTNPDGILFVYRGELFALSVGFFWAIASIIYSRIGNKIAPLELNFLKGMVGISIICLILLCQNAFTIFFEPTTIILLLTSGAISIGLGDTFYLTALKLIGARKGALLRTLAPPIAAIISMFFLKELLPGISWFGILLIISGVAWVVSARSSENPLHQNGVQISLLRHGVLLGFLAALTEAIGTVLSRSALSQSTINPLVSTLIRLVGGEIVILASMMIKRHRPGSWLKLPEAPRLAMLAFIAIFIGTFLGIWFQQMSLQITAAGIALTLISTTPLFVLFLTALMGEKIGWRPMLGVIGAMLGVALLFLGKQ